MKRCERCGQVSQPEASFCSACGASLTGQQDLSLEETQIHVAVAEETEQPAEQPTAQPAPTQTDQKATFVVQEGAKAGSVFPLGNENISLGRHPRSDIFLDDITVSRRHATVSFASEAHQVEDLDSLNGTYVNRNRVQNATLKDGDILQVGRFKLEYRKAGKR